MACSAEQTMAHHTSCRTKTPCRVYGLSLHDMPLRCAALQAMPWSGHALCDTCEREPGKLT